MNPDLFRRDLEAKPATGETLTVLGKVRRRPAVSM
jgi:hypothetical protein